MCVFSQTANFFERHYNKSLCFLLEIWFIINLRVFNKDVFKKIKWSNYRAVGHDRFQGWEGREKNS